MFRGARAETTDLRGTPRRLQQSTDTDRVTPSHGRPTTIRPEQGTQVTPVTPAHLQQRQHAMARHNPENRGPTVVGHTRNIWDMGPGNKRLTEASHTPVICGAYNAKAWLREQETHRSKPLPYNLGRTSYPSRETPSIFAGIPR